MNRALIAALLGALSIVFLAAPGSGGTKKDPQVAMPLPAIAPDAASSDAPRECSTAKGIVTACTYL